MVKLPTNLTEDAHPWPPPELHEWFHHVDNSPTPTWLFEDLIPRDTIVLISGRPKLSWKSWLCKLMAMAATGACNVPPFKAAEPTKVLLIEAEGPMRPTRKRFSMLAAGMGCNIQPGMAFIMHRYNFVLEDKEWMDRICNFVEAEGIGLVFIDTLAKCSSGNENSTQDIGNVMRAIDRIRHAGNGATVVLVHHLAKANFKEFNTDPDIDDEVRGSSAIAGAYDVHIALRQPSSVGLQMIVRQSEDEMKYFKLNWEVDKEKESVVFSAETTNIEDLDTTTLKDYLEDIPEKDKLYSATMLSRFWEFPYDAAKKLADKLVDNDLLEKQGGKYKCV